MASALLLTSIRLEELDDSVTFSSFQNMSFRTREGHYKEFQHEECSCQASLRNTTVAHNYSGPLCCDVYP